jgi:hypothetical protein
MQKTSKDSKTNHLTQMVQFHARVGMPSIYSWRSKLWLGWQIIRGRARGFAYIDSGMIVRGWLLSSGEVFITEVKKIEITQGGIGGLRS